jgi:hypothetical protein
MSVVHTLSRANAMLNCAWGFSLQHISAPSHSHTKRAGTCRSNCGLLMHVLCCPAAHTSLAPVRHTLPRVGP